MASTGSHNLAYRSNIAGHVVFLIFGRKTQWPPLHEIVAHKNTIAYSSIQKHGQLL